MWKKHGEYIQNPGIPRETHNIIQRWYDILDCKPHVYGGMYLDMPDKLTPEGFQEYQEELYNNLPQWHRDSLFSMGGDDAKIIEILQLNPGSIVLKVEIEN